MAEKIVSPGVFTKENDLSFLQQGVADIGAAFIGPFKEGPLVPTIVNSQTEFEQLFGIVDDTYYTPLAVQKYLAEAGTATICRVAGQSGYTETAPLLLIAASGSQSGALGILFNTSASANVGFTGTTISDLNGSGDFSILLNGSTGYSSSIELADANNIEAVFGTSPYGEANAYSYAFFKGNGFIFNTGSYTISSTNGILSGAVTSSAFAGNISASVVVLGNQKFSGSILLQDGNACEAKTPYIQSQLINNTRFPLFQFETITAGNVGNTKVKIGITNVKAAGTSNGTDYGTFTVVVRDFNDTDKKKNILETFSNVNLDPNSPNYINRVIGDRKRTINSTTGKITETGDWVNYSKYIRLVSSDRNPLLDSSKIPVQAVPFAHAAYQLPVNAGAYANFIPRVTFTTGSVVSGSTSYSGIDLDNNADNKIYMKPIPVSAGSGSNSIFSLDTICGLSLLTTDSSTIAMRQFIVAFQEGFDGYAPNTNAADINASTPAGKLAYGTHIAALSNADEYDINMVVAPHVNRVDHDIVWTSILDMVEQRADAFFIGDAGNADTKIPQTLQQAEGVDSNYAAVYYPWVKTLDVNTNKLITVPPSVLLPGVFAANDRIAAEWFAPAGLNRGGLVGAVSVLDRLTQSEKDTLYEGKVNPIVQFPGQGIVVFGQKTLQDKPSALDRINVRRLLLTVRKYIASTSRYLVFEQNTAETRNRFLNIVNPYLESIQQRQGLYAFRVVMDDTNNTPDVIDRNILKGAIYLQPTKTAEFIQIDFNILPTGAAFNG